MIWVFSPWLLVFILFCESVVGIVIVWGCVDVYSYTKLGAQKNLPLLHTYLPLLTHLLISYDSKRQLEEGTRG